MLCTLCLLFAANSLTVPARYSGDAALLFQDGRQRLEAGKYGTAYLAFYALISVWPESPLVGQARELMQQARELEDRQEHAAIVHSIRFLNLRQVTEREVLQKFREREVALAVEERCLPRDFDAAKAVMEELLAGKGVGRPRVKIAVRRSGAGQVDVTIRSR